MTESKRKVSVLEAKWNPQSRTSDLTHVCDGVFHCWGLDVEEDENGFSSYSVAIVELPDGTVITPPARLIKFKLTSD